MKWNRKAAEQGDDYALISLGGMYAKGEGVEQDFKEAFKWYRKVMAKEDHDPVTQGELGWGLYLIEQYDLAMDYNLKALKGDPKLAYVHANVGLLHMLERDLDKAMPSYRQCAKLEKKGIEDLAIVDLLDLTKKHPDIAEIHYALGFCYEELGDKEAAGTHYSKYVGALKKGKFVEQAKAALKKIEANKRD